jgi:hypothetical protein
MKRARDSASKTPDSADDSWAIQRNGLSISSGTGASLKCSGSSGHASPEAVDCSNKNCEEIVVVENTRSSVNGSDLFEVVIARSRSAQDRQLDADEALARRLQAEYNNRRPTAPVGTAETAQSSRPQKLIEILDDEDEVSMNQDGRLESLDFRRRARNVSEVDDNDGGDSGDSEGDSGAPMYPFSHMFNLMQQNMFGPRAARFFQHNRNFIGLLRGSSSSSSSSSFPPTFSSSSGSVPLERDVGRARNATALRAHLSTVSRDFTAEDYELLLRLDQMEADEQQRARARARVGGAASFTNPTRLAGAASKSQVQQLPIRTLPKMASQSKSRQKKTSVNGGVVVGGAVASSPSTKAGVAVSPSASSTAAHEAVRPSFLLVLILIRAR